MLTAGERAQIDCYYSPTGTSGQRLAPATKVATM
jgi:hypothetical protein